MIEIAPLAFMRGRTLNESFVILDEAQNTTPEQMKMFLTRIGFGSRAVVTGDITQTDLPRGKESGLRHAMRVLRNVKAIAFVHFTAEDVVRHPLVQSIVAAYAKEEESRARQGGRVSLVCPRGRDSERVRLRAAAESGGDSLVGRAAVLAA